MPESAFDHGHLIPAGGQHFCIINGISCHRPGRIQIFFGQVGIDSFSILCNHKTVAQSGQFIFQMCHFITMPDLRLAAIHFRTLSPVVFPKLLLVVIDHALGKLHSILIAVHIHKSMPVAPQRGIQAHNEHHRCKQNRYQNHHNIGQSDFFLNGHFLCSPFPAGFLSIHIPLCVQISMAG